MENAFCHKAADKRICQRTSGLLQRGEQTRSCFGACVERVGAQSKAAGQLAPAGPVPTRSRGLHSGSLFWRAFGPSDDQLLSKISGLTLKVMGLTV